ncbi:MAG TPA: hypothetical protein VFQ54_13355 [Thermomicrobiales bacterium]|nr:hypothetical protein [Thermomicrobiales bacterium]
MMVPPDQEDQEAAQVQSPRQEPVEKELRRIAGLSAPIFWAAVIILVVAVVLILFYTL